MYCSNCGTQIAAELNYCSRCGQKTVRTDPAAASIAANLSGAIGYIVAPGLIAFVFLIISMLKLGMDQEQVLKIAFLYLATLFGICFLLIRQSASLAKADPAAPQVEAAKPQAQYIQPVRTAQLEEHREPASVTEPTTRTLDKVPIDRNA